MHDGHRPGALAATAINSPLKRRRRAGTRRAHGGGACPAVERRASGHVCPAGTAQALAVPEDRRGTGLALPAALASPGREGGVIMEGKSEKVPYERVVEIPRPGWRGAAPGRRSPTDRTTTW
jgi:hypothetical protein